MRRLCAIGVALAVAGGGISCSLITSLDNPTSKEAGAADASSDQNAASDASPIILANVGDAGVVGLYVDSRTNNLFFTATDLGNVYEIAAGADADASAVITQLARPDRITGSSAVDGSWVVYVAAFGPSATGAGIFRLFDDGGSSPAVGSGSVVASGTSYPLHPYGIAVFGSTQPTLFWTNCNDPSPSLTCDSANSQIIETDLTKGLSTVFAPITGDFARDIVTTDDMVFWDTAAAKLYAQPLDGAAPQVLEPNCAGVIYYAQQAAGTSVSARIYFTSAASCGSTNIIQYRDLSNLSTAAQTFAMNDVNDVFSMTSDGTYLYWANHGDSTIVRQLVADSTASPEVIVTSPENAGPPKQMVVSRGVLYWTTDSSVVSFTLP